MLSKGQQLSLLIMFTKKLLNLVSVSMVQVNHKLKTKWVDINGFCVICLTFLQRVILGNRVIYVEVSESSKSY